MLIKSLKQDRRKIEGAQMFPSEFVSNFMYMPDKGKLSPFSFRGRRYLVPIYDTPSKRILLQCGRQVEKSTTLGNKCLTYTMLQEYFRVLFVSPTQQQTETFSRDKIATPINLSEKLQWYTRGNSEIVKKNVLYKKFRTHSDITFRYAFLHADRVRGISADMLLLDEIQDILTDVIPIIEEALSHSAYDVRIYSGTPKSLDNTISYYWNTFSTKNEWVIPCDKCGGGDFRHWNIIGEKNIGDDGLICNKCGQPINCDHPDARWASMRSPTWLANPPVQNPYEGYRIPQVIAPWIDWSTIIDKRRVYGRDQFFNEVLGLAYDSGNKMITQETLISQCGTNSMSKAVNFIGRSPLFMGIDWGTAEKSYTVMSIGGYLGSKFTYLFFKRFEGEEAEPQKTMAIINKYISMFKINVVGVDYGGGFDRNDQLIRNFGISRIARYQYVNTKKIYFDRSLHRWMVNRTEALMALINAINRRDEFILPQWKEFEVPFGQDLLSIFSEYNESRRTTVVNKTPGATDDTLHSMLYCFLASMIRHPRPDILTPTGDK